MLKPRVSAEVESHPLSYRKALDYSCYTNWKDSIGKEFLYLMENKTCTYCSKVPDGSHPISCKWVYLLKTNPDGRRHFKAPLVIERYEQTDIGETFAPVAKLVSLHMILALVALDGWEIVDVVTTFLNPPINNDIYIFLPQGIESLDPSKPVSIRTCKLNKAHYSLKEAPRLSYGHVDEFLLLAGFKKSSNNPNLHPPVQSELLLQIYVDDLLIMPNIVNKSTELKTFCVHATE